MKRVVKVTFLSIVTEPDGDVRETKHIYDGTWYHQGGSDYLVYDDEGIHTTLRWDSREVRLYRRGERMEAYQVFRPGQSLEFILGLAGNTLPMTTTTHSMACALGDGGGELALAYTLHSGPTDLGEFQLKIRMDTNN